MYMQLLTHDLYAYEDDLTRSNSHGRRNVKPVGGETPSRFNFSKHQKGRTYCG